MVTIILKFISNFCFFYFKIIEIKSNPSIEFFIKDLSMFPNKNRDDIIILDNFIYSYALDLKHGIPIKPYYMGKKDNELKYICDKLAAIRNENPNVTAVEFIDKQFGLTDFYNFLAGTGHAPAPNQRHVPLGPGGKPLRTSVILGQPQSPPSPSPERTRRLSSNMYQSGKLKPLLEYN